MTQQIETIADRLRHLIDKHTNGRKTVFARKLRIPVSTLYGYLDHNRPIRSDYILAICDKYNVDMSWLLTGHVGSTTKPILRPCPFCMSKDVGVNGRHDRRWVQCITCGATGPAYDMYEHPTLTPEAMATKAWNGEVTCD